MILYIVKKSVCDREITQHITHGARRSVYQRHQFRGWNTQVVLWGMWSIYWWDFSSPQHHSAHKHTKSFNLKSIYLRAHLYHVKNSKLYFIDFINKSSIVRGVHLHLPLITVTYFAKIETTENHTLLSYTHTQEVHKHANREKETQRQKRTINRLEKWTWVYNGYITTLSMNSPRTGSRISGHTIKHTEFWSRRKHVENT